MTNFIPYRSVPQTTPLTRDERVEKFTNLYSVKTSDALLTIRGAIDENASDAFYRGEMDTFEHGADCLIAIDAVLEDRGICYAD